MNQIYLATVVEVSTVRHQKAFDNIESAYRDVVSYCYKNLLWFYERHYDPSINNYWNAFCPSTSLMNELKDLVAQEKYENAYQKIKEYSSHYGMKVSMILLKPEVKVLEINK